MEKRSSAPLNAICGALPGLPARLREVGQFVVANEFDATCHWRHQAVQQFGTPLAEPIG